MSKILNSKMNKTIRETIQDYQNEIINTDLLPERASIILTEISAIYGNILDRMKDTEMAYNKILLTHLETEKTANRASIKARITQEYSDMKDAANTEKVCLQMIRSLGKFLKVKESEISTLKYQ